MPKPKSYSKSIDNRYLHLGSKFCTKQINQNICSCFSWRDTTWEYLETLHSWWVGKVMVFIAKHTKSIAAKVVNSNLFHKHQPWSRNTIRLSSISITGCNAMQLILWFSYGYIFISKTRRMNLSRVGTGLVRINKMSNCMALAAACQTERSELLT